MNWASKHPVEVAAEWGAPLLLAVAAGWAASAAGLPVAAAVAAGTMALGVGIVTMRLASGGPIAVEAGFEPVPLEDCVTDGELLLDDPLIEAEPDLRIVQLFAGGEPTPGEMVARIEDYLNDGRRTSGAELTEQRPVDASAALHAALANIRTSLR